jgi:cytoskeleton protein RodZ
MLGVVLLLAGYGLWYHYSGTQRRLAEQVPAVPAELAPLATPPKIVVAPVTPAPAPAPAAPVVTTAAVGAPAPAAATPPPAPGTSTAAPPVPGAAPANAAPATATTPTAPTVAAAPPPGAGLVISATQDAWIEVHDPAGNILFSKVLHPGDSWPVPQEAGLILTTGNAGGTVIVNNGVAGAPLGAPSAVLRNYQLTPAAGAGTTATPASATSAPIPAATTASPAAAAAATNPPAAPGKTQSPPAPSGTP